MTSSIEAVNRMTSELSQAHDRVSALAIDGLVAFNYVFEQKSKHDSDNSWRMSD